MKRIVKMLGVVLLMVFVMTGIAAAATTLKITKQPVTQYAEAGTKAKFTVTATTSATSLSYQWQYRKNSSDTWKNSGQSGNKTATLSVAVTAGLDGYQFRCVVSDSLGQKAYSSAATLYTHLKITSWPKDTEATVGSTAKFTMAAVGPAPLTYQWQYRKNSADSWKTSGQSGNKTNTLSVAVKANLDGYQFRCYVTDATGAKSYTNTVTLTVQPRITAQPVSYSVPAGVLAQFSVKASGTGLTYQWQYRRNSSSAWTDSGQSGNKTATLSVTTKSSFNGFQFRCVVKDSDGNTVTSNAATLTIGELAINTRNFPDKAFRTYIAENVDSNGNGTLSADEILGTESLYLFSSIGMYGYIGIGAADLKGIEYFANLTELYCADNKIIQLDLSKNTKLRVIHCENNQLTSLRLNCKSLAELSCMNNSLTSLNLSGYTCLESLWCYNNQLTSLNVTGCSKIDRLDCRENQLTSLNVTACTELYHLNCGGNRLTSLNIANNKVLEYLFCWGNRLTSLNVAGYEYLTMMSCYGNQLKSLSLNGCSALETVWCFDNQLESLTIGTASLINLYCDGNKLKSLNISNCTELALLNCEENLLSSLNLSKCTKLQRLFCGHNKLTALSLGSNTELLELSCPDNQLSALDLSKNTKLQSVCIRGNGFDTVDLSKNLDLQNVDSDAMGMLEQPKSHKMASGGKAVFTVTVCGTGLTYQWQYRKDSSASWANSGQNGNKTAELTVAATASLNGYQFRCVITNQNGRKLTSKTVTLTVGNILVNATNFPDENFRNYVSEVIDTNHNGALSSAELAAVTSIDVPGKNITGLKGIEFFFNLEKLTCNSYYVNGETWGGYASNSIGELDVSRNLELKELICSDNGIQRLNLKHCRKLEILDCTSNHAIASLDLKSNTALKELSCGNTSLTSLDLTKNVHLKTLNVYWISIITETLDLSKNTEVEYLYIGGSGIAEIDLTNNTKLKLLYIEPYVKVTGMCEGAVRQEYEN